MPPYRNNENQQPNRNPPRLPLNSHRGAESGRLESSIRDDKPDLGGDERDVKPDIAGGQGAQETAEGRNAMGILPNYAYAAHPAQTGTPPQRLGPRLNNTIPPYNAIPLLTQPRTYIRAQNPSHPDSPVFYFRRFPPHARSLNSPSTATPNSASNSNSRALFPQWHDTRLPLHPDIPTPDMARQRYPDRGGQPSDGHQLRQFPSTQSSSSLRPSINNDTPTSGEESGLEDHIHSPNYGADESPTVHRTSNAGVPLAAADPAIHPMGPMHLPNSTQRRVTLAAQGRPEPYPHSPLSRMHRTVATARAGPDRAALGNGRPGRVNPRDRALSTPVESIIRTFSSAGRRIPSVLEAAENVIPSFTAVPSGPTAPSGQVPSTPLVAFPGESFTPQVYVPGNTYAQTPTAVPSGTPAIGPDGKSWSAISLPRFYAEQVGQPATPGMVSEIARRLESVRMRTPLAEPKQPKIPVPTPGNNAANKIRNHALAAILQMAKDERGANFADPEHFDIFDKYVTIALSDGTTSEILGGNIETIAAKFTEGLEGRAAYLCHHGQPIPEAILTSLQRAHELGVELWGANACMTQLFKHEMESVQAYMAAQKAEATDSEAMEH